jgi:hypothetical protein
MSAKLKKTVAPAASKKPEAKKAAPAAKKAEPKKAEAKKAEGKKGDAKKGEEEADLRTTAASDEGDAEDMEDEEAGSGGGGGGGNAAALAAAAGSGDSSASFKNFRHHPDMENFYRFIYENDLRIEALAIIDQVMADKLAKKAAKG